VPLFECVPNFSEGRDASVIAHIAGAAGAVEGVAVLDVHSDPDHNRSVVTLAGDGLALVEAALAMMRVATSSLDLRSHRGEHPRIGATDVVPFVPLSGAGVDDAVLLAQLLAARVWEELSIPVYFYGDAARRPERRDLAIVRAGQFEGLRSAVEVDPARHPDVGEARLHPTAGAVAVGVRPLLVAFNVSLSTSDAAVARRVARTVRGRDGGLPEVKALGFEVRGRAQVSMNLTDFRVTPIEAALEAVRRAAADLGAEVIGTELVGLVPEAAVASAAGFYLQLPDFSAASVLESRLHACGLGAPVSLAGLAAGLASRNPVPGGGSAAAAAGALGAALGEMVGAGDAAGRLRFLELVEEDAAAFAGVVAAGRRGSDAWVVAMRRAAGVALESAALAARLRAALGAAPVPPSMASDLAAALALLDAARTGAVAAALANLADLRAAGAGGVDELERAIAALG
jgi:glutamate formiminotransferase/formiminotetrahydrofolate cyclodeaminase